jgi:hypothetical protein
MGRLGEILLLGRNQSPTKIQMSTRNHQNNRDRNFQTVREQHDNVTASNTGPAQQSNDTAESALDKYNATLKEVGKVQTLSGEDLVLREYVYGKLWKKVKFILCETELDLNGKLAQKILHDLKVKEKYKESYWARNRHKVQKMINQKRNNTIGALKKEFIRKFQLMTTLISFRVLLTLRTDDNYVTIRLGNRALQG